MSTFSKNLRSSLRRDQRQVPPAQSPGIWLLLLKDRVQEESPEFGLMSFALNHELGTLTGTFVYANQTEDISYQLEWSYREPDSKHITDLYSARNCGYYARNNGILSQKDQNSEILGISLECPGKHPLIFIGIRRAE